MPGQVRLALFFFAVAALIVEILQNGVRQSTVALTAAGLSVGRSPSNGLVLRDRLVSKFHARLDLSGARVLLTDLESAHGTFRRGERVRSAEISVGDEVSIGPYTLRLRTQDSTSSAGTEVASPTKPAPPENPAPGAALVESLSRLASIIGTSDLKTLLETLVDHSRRLFEAETAYIVLASEGQLTPIVARSGVLSPDREKFSQTLCRRAFGQRKPIVIGGGGTPDSGEPIKSLLDRSVSFALALPLAEDVVVHGVLYLESQQVRAGTQPLPELLHKIAQLAGKALGVAIDREQIVKDRERWRWIATSEGGDPQLALTCRSPRMLKVLELVYAAAREDVTVLIRGESGTGKEVTARTIHRLSDRRDGPFIAINCGAIPAELMESMLFGHEKGAYTGAVTQEHGRFELSNGGTLFLDEIGDLPKDLQVKLLRVLESRQFERIGGRASIRWDARLIAATNRDLENAVQKGDFREDLYYRVNVMGIGLPPLRERSEDLELLVQEILRDVNGRFKKKLEGVTSGAMAALQAYAWPGNIRELRNVIERAFILETADRIALASLPFAGPGQQPLAPVETQAAALGAAPEPVELRTLDEVVRDTERQYIALVLRQVGGNVTQAARILGLSRVSLYRRLRLLGLQAPPELDDLEE